MHVMKILYMASLCGLVTETKKTIKKITAFFTKNCYKTVLKKKITAVFMEKPLQKPFYSHINKKNIFLKKFTMIFTKGHIYSGF
jgi:hypothetical protein